MNIRNLIILALVLILVRYLVFRSKYSRIKNNLKNLGRLTGEQVQNAETILNFCAKEKCTERQAAYILATAWHESRFRPVRECFALSDASARRCVSFRAYGVVVHGNVYYGRGFVQLTWPSNYRKAEIWAGVPGLLKNPDKALDVRNATKILVKGMMEGRFTGKSLPDYIGSGVSDPLNARRVVNGTDRAELIAGHYYGLLK